MRHVMKVGPLSLERGTASAYVAFGDAGLDVGVETDDEKGLVALARRNIGEVLVCEPSLSREAVRRGLTVATPSPAALSMKAVLAVSLDHGRAMAAISPELALELIEATLEFDAAAPWQAFEPDEAIAVRIEPGGRELEGCVLGQAGEEFGLVLYHRVGSIQKMIAFADQGRPDKARSLDSTTMLVERGEAFVVDAIEEMTGVALAPHVLHLTRGKVSPATTHDVAGLVAALRAVTALATRNAEPRGRSVGGETDVVAHAMRVTASHSRTNPSYDAVGRNELCPCGSGKKYKRCHLDAINDLPQDSAKAAIHDRDGRVVREVLAFGVRRFGADAIADMLEQKFGDRTAPLQLIASRIGASLIESRNIPVLLSGNVIRIPGHDLFVAEACSGLRSLTALVNLGVLLGAMLLVNPWSRVTLLVLAVPMAILINGFRIFLTAFLVFFVSPEAGSGFMHTTEGWLMFVIAFASLGAVASLLLFIEGKLARRNAPKDVDNG